MPELVIDVSTVSAIAGLQPLRIEHERGSYFCRLHYALDGLEKEYGIVFDIGKRGDNGFMLPLNHFEGDPAREAALQDLIPALHERLFSALRPLAGRW